MDKPFQQIFPYIQLLRFSKILISNQSYVANLTHMLDSYRQIEKKLNNFILKNNFMMYKHKS